MISQAEFHRIYMKVPRACVDIIPIYRKSFLLGKRSKRVAAAKGAWWYLGTGIRFGETPTNAVRRCLKREAGISRAKLKFVMVNSKQFRKERIHDVSLVYLAFVSSSKVHGNHENTELRWFQRINPEWPLLVKKTLREIL